MLCMYSMYVLDVLYVVSYCLLVTLLPYDSIRVYLLNDMYIVLRTPFLWPAAAWLVVSESPGHSALPCLLAAMVVIVRPATEA